MKRRLLWLLCVCIIFIFTGCCSHDYSNATCTVPKTCKKCGEIEGEVLEHDFSNATCTTPQICNRCGEIGEEMLGHDFLPATYEEPATCTRCGITSGDKLIPVSEWGFNNLEEMGNALIKINGYDLSDNSNAYVIVDITKAARKFDNGYMLRWKYTIEDGKWIWGSTSSPEKYDIASNDSIVLNNGWKSLTIDERKTHSTKDNFVVFVENGGPASLYSTTWYIPYSLIDWDRGAVDDPTSDNENEYILYLIP